MGVPKLTYFDFDGGRGEVARLAFAIGGVPFVDDRVPFAAWNERKQQTPFGGLPVLEIDGRSVAQSNGINGTSASLLGSIPTIHGRPPAATRRWMPWRTSAQKLSRPDRIARGLVEHYERIRTLPHVKAHYAARQTGA